MSLFLSSQFLGQLVKCIPCFLLRYAAVYLAAGLENLVEEMVLQCLPAKADALLTAAMFEHAIANNGDLWGLLQPYAHLNAGRIASGEPYFLLLPKCGRAWLFTQICFIYCSQVHFHFLAGLVSVA